MRKFTRTVCFILCAALLLAPATFAAADRGARLHARTAQVSADDAIASWGAYARLHRELARLLGVVPIAVPSPGDDDEGVFSSLGLSDDPDPTGSRPDDEEDDDETSAPGGDQSTTGNDNDDGVFQIGGR